jgi:hypothetical protein
VKLILFLVIILSCCSSQLFADDADNLEQLEILYLSLLDSLLSRFPVSDTSVVIYPIGAAQPVNWLIDKEINTALRKHGVMNVQDSAAVSEFKSARIEYQSLACDIRYIRMDKKNARREADIHLYLKYIDSNSSVLFADFYRRTEADTVRRNKIDHLENLHLPFTQGKHLTSSLARLAEPLAASFLTGMIILLFYFYRSH